MVTSGWRMGRDPNLLVLALGCIALLVLALFIPFSGFWVVDSGLRYLQVVNIVDRHHFGGFWLDYPLQQWDPAFELVPFGLVQTFVHNTRLYAQYPPWFCYASAPFYALWGHVGLRILPLVSAMGLLLGVAVLARQCGFRNYALVAALVVFGSPLLPYAYTFWDILPALFFGVWGLVLALESEHRGSTPLAVAAGVTWWLAFLMREEYLLWVAACFLPMLVRPTARRYVLVAGAVFGIGAVALMVVNQALIGKPLFFQASTGSGKAWDYTWSIASRGWVAYRYLAFVQGVPAADAALFCALGAAAFLPCAVNDFQRIMLLTVSLAAAAVVRFFAWDSTQPIVTQYLLNSLAVATPLAFAGFPAWDLSCCAQHADQERVRLRTAVVAALLFLTFTLALSVPSSALGLNFGPRLLLPIYPPLLLGGLHLLWWAIKLSQANLRRWILLVSAAYLAFGFADSGVYLTRLAVQYRQISRLETFFDRVEPQLPIVTEQSWFVTMLPNIFYKRVILPGWDGAKVSKVYELVKQLSPQGFLYVTKSPWHSGNKDGSPKVLPIEIPPSLRPVDSAFSLYVYKVNL
ncbi:MAG: hypothetical protein N2Z21_00760 [Candidatus Sumerlaeaceae bacterium]|nr:hypothetical protein [Candidatus Sumerlaeaceae bacterium]